jgi:hypothetical protein
MFNYEQTVEDTRSSTREVKIIHARRPERVSIARKTVDNNRPHGLAIRAARKTLAQPSSDGDISENEQFNLGQDCESLSGE